jgi:DNA-binding XRE family transcriptional regulator
MSISSRCHPFATRESSAAQQVASCANDAKRGQTPDAASRARDLGHLAAAILSGTEIRSGTRDGKTGTQDWSSGRRAPTATALRREPRPSGGYASANGAWRPWWAEPPPLAAATVLLWSDSLVILKQGGVRPVGRQIQFAKKAPEAKELRQRAGAWLKELRARAGLSQIQLAEHLGLKYYTFVSQVENGFGRVPTESMEAWARALAVEPSAFARRLLSFYDPELHRLLFEVKE